MIPNPAQNLADLAARLASRILPELATPHSQADVALISELLITLSQEFESAIEKRMQDINDMKALFAGATDNWPGAGAVAAYREKVPKSLLLEDVNQLHAEGLGYLIKLHAWAEEADEDLHRDIWHFLHTYYERHQFALPTR